MRTAKWNRLQLRAAFLFLSMLAIALTCSAHPMGNFSISHYSRITLSQSKVEVLYLIDMAEIPTFQEMRQSGMTIAPEDPSTANYLAEQAQALKEGLSLQIDGQTVQLNPVGRHITFADGAGGLPTMKIEVDFETRPDAAAAVRSLSYVDQNFSGRAGWKEIVVHEDGVTIVESNASGIDRSQQLTNYSSDVLNSPPQQLSALITFKLAIPAQLTNALGKQLDLVPSRLKPKATGLEKRGARLPLHVEILDPGNKPETQLKKAYATSPIARPSYPASTATTPRNRFTELISSRQTISLWILLSAGLISAGLGALHALEPGHGKTIVAAYLVESRGTVRHAVLLGVVVTAAHTAGVYAFGILTLYASRYIVPDHLYPWLGAVSGLSVAGLGAFTFLRHLTGQSGDHSHASGARHSHSFFSLFAPAKTASSGNARSAEQVDGPVTAVPANRSMSLRELCLLGISGGIVPCPAALVVLLSAFSLHRIGFGLFLISAFSAGLALVLVTVGIVMVYGKRIISSRLSVGASFGRYLPALSSGFMAVLGLGITCSAIASMNIFPGLIAKDTLLPFVTVVSLGVLLGMRHSTDADHVVAVSTIVSRQGSLKGSATIGLLWGLGHTITIFLVGTAIIIFGVVIPPWLGLSMEFCVAVMLILLGVLNISGALRWIAERFTRLDIGPNRWRGDLLNRGLSAIQTSSSSRSQTIWRNLTLAMSQIGVYQTVRPLVVGLVHGLAGSAAVALLVLSTIKSPLWATAYLLVFGFGTMAGMMVMTSAISIPLIYTKTRFSSITRHLAVISGFFSLGFGTFLVYHIGFVDGLFTSHMRWIPQ